MMDNFKKWIFNLNEIFLREWGVPNYAEDTGLDQWRTFYDEGYSPLEAFKEEASYACP
ncbi:hypothetical protein [Acetobacter syzygii]|uniref:hypothetical protein n=1 Tax=Acetobacter syzygii TaxID=146476 RepID=UPI00156F43BB|nr:hypothetical protein [Acetobacter syzygii]NSL93878.1 hypothetical protein [Acetobacter syzygii]